VCMPNPFRTQPTTLRGSGRKSFTGWSAMTGVSRGAAVADGAGSPGGG